MKVVTCLWIVAMVGMLFWGTAASDRGVQNLGNGLVMVDNSVRWKSDVESGRMAAVFVMSLVCPSVPYAIAMVFLGVLHFAERDD